MSVRHARGFTVIELMIVVGVVGILLAVGMPSLQETINSITTNSAAKTLVASLNYARSEAVKRGRTVSVCASDSGTDCAVNSWNDGWIVFVDENEDADGAAGSVDAGDSVLRVYQGAGINILTFTDDMQQFDSQGFGLNTTMNTFLLCPEDLNSANAQSVELSITGRARRIHTGLDCS
jgi:type IV fimbrial biogenesis protein FimT